MSTMDKETYKYFHGVIKMLHLLNVNIKHPGYDGFAQRYVAENINDQSTQSFLSYCLIQNPGDRCALHVSPVSRQGATRISIATTASKESTLVLATRITDHISHQTPASLSSYDPNFQITLLAALLPAISPQLVDVIGQLNKYNLSGIQSTVSAARRSTAYNPDIRLSEAYFQESKLDKKRSADLELRRTASDWGCELSTAIERTLELITKLLDHGLTMSSSETPTRFYSVSILAWMLSTSVIARSYIFSFFDEEDDDEQQKESLERLFDALVRLGRYARGAGKFKRYLKRSCPVTVPRIECVVVKTRSTVLEVGELREALKELHNRNSDWECKEIVGETLRANFVDKSIMVGNGMTRRQSNLREEWGKPIISTMHPELCLILKLRESGINRGTVGLSQSRCGGSEHVLDGISWCLIPEGFWDVEEEIDGKVEMFLPSEIERLDMYVLRRLERKLWDYVISG